MTKYTLYNSSHIPRDVYGSEGHFIIPASGSIDRELDNSDLDILGRMSGVTVERVSAPDKSDPTPVPTPVAAADTPDLDALRADYEELTGKKPDGRWSAERLKTEIDKALS